MKKLNTKIKRKKRNRKKLREVSSNRLRVSVSKSLRNLSAQIIDDKARKTLNKKIEISKLIGETLAQRAKQKNISEVYFDRGSYRYHGRVKAFAESLRKNGLKF